MTRDTATTGTETFISSVAALTTVRHPADDDVEGHLAVLRELRDREAIRDLALLYTRAVDDYDLDTVVQLFTEDGVFERRGTPIAGRAALREFYAGAMRANRTMIHIPDSHVVRVVPGREAIGWAAGRAELVIDGTPMLAAFRYDDAYRCVDDRWFFARRSITFKHALPVDDLASGLASEERMRWPGAASAPADYPESLPTWAGFHH